MTFIPPDLRKIILCGKYRSSLAVIKYVRHCCVMTKLPHEDITVLHFTALGSDFRYDTLFDS